MTFTANDCNIFTFEHTSTTELQYVLALQAKEKRTKTRNSMLTV